MTPEQREDIRWAVRRAMELWPNAHLGTVNPREDMRQAFRYIRKHGVRELEFSLAGYEDM